MSAAVAGWPAATRASRPAVNITVRFIGLVSADTEVARAAHAGAGQQCAKSLPCVKSLQCGLTAMGRDLDPAAMDPFLRDLIRDAQAWFRNRKRALARVTFSSRTQPSSSGDNAAGSR